MVNRRANSLIEPECTLMLMTVDRSDGELRREFRILKLEREKIMLFPLTWTVVHPIDHESPLHGKSQEDLKSLQAEFLILVKRGMKRFRRPFTSGFLPLRRSGVGGLFKPSFGVDGKARSRFTSTGSAITSSENCPVFGLEDLNNLFARQRDWVGFHAAGAQGAFGEIRPVGGAMPYSESGGMPSWRSGGGARRLRPLGWRCCRHENCG